MRTAAALWVGLLALTGCVSTNVDYSELHSAAEGRLRRAGAATPRLGQDVKALLSRPLSAEAASRVAVLNNPGLRASLEELAQAQAQLASVKRLPNPTVEGAMRFRRGERADLEVGAMLDLTELALALSRGGAAEAGVSASQLSAVGAILDLSFEAREAFYHYQAAVQVLELRRSILDAMSASAELAARLREAGNIPELERVNAQSAFLEARINHQRAEAAVAGAREQLNATMGLWGRATEWQAETRLPEMPETELAVDKLEQESVRASLDLQIAKQRFTASARSANVSRAAGFLPELRAGVSAERDEHWAVGPAVELEVPLFYQGQGEVASARAEMRRQRELYTDLAIRLRATARSAATRLLVAREGVAYYRDVLLPAKQKIVDETLLQYNAMSIGAFQLLQAKRDQIETARGFIEQLLEYWVARTRAEQLLSGRLGKQQAGVPVQEIAVGAGSGPTH